MDKLSLISGFDVNKPSVIAFYGGGGKTSLIFALANELKLQGKKVLITTTTKIFPFAGLKTTFFEEKNINRKILAKLLEEQNPVIAGQRLSNDGKIEGFHINTITDLKSIGDTYILVEADGSKGKSIKGHAGYEPVLPDCADLITPVIGADILGASIVEENIHRVNIFRKTICRENEIKYIDEHLTASTFAHMIKIGISMSPGARIKAVLNKSDKLSASANAAKIAAVMFNQYNIPELLVTAAREKYPVRYIFKQNSLNSLVKISAVILAAGESARMGRDKLSLPFKKHTILEETLKQLLAANIDQLVLVIKPGDQLNHLSKWDRVEIAVNHDYKQGQSSSLITGLNAVNNCSQGVLFALGDQPAITTSVYNLLLKSYSQKLKIVTLPLYNGKRGNPVIFDRFLWSELVKLEGDVGGRNVIDKLAKEDLDPVDCDDPAVLIDVDTPDDYRYLHDKNNKGEDASG